jgi:uncharacterized protein (TIGR03067 family)
MTEEFGTAAFQSYHSPRRSQEFENALREESQDKSYRNQITDNFRDAYPFGSRDLIGVADRAPVNSICHLIPTVSRLVNRIALVFALCGCVGSVAVAAPVPKALKKPATDPLIGEWREMTADSNGQSTGQATGYIWRFEAEGIASVHWPDGTVVTAEYRLDRTLSPHRYDWNLPRHNARFVGVFEVDGDTLRTATTAAGRERPAEVKPGESVEYRVYVRATPSR